MLDSILSVLLLCSPQECTASRPFLLFLAEMLQ